MTSELELKGKWKFLSGGERLVVFKKSGEKTSHVLMKAFLWGLYRDRYPGLSVEVFVKHRYKPDVVAPREGPPVFWGECGRVAPSKLRHLFRQYPQTHFAVAKWESAGRWADILSECLDGLKRAAPVELLVFPADSEERFVGPKGLLHDLESQERRRW